MARCLLRSEMGAKRPTGHSRHSVRCHPFSDGMFERSGIPLTGRGSKSRTPAPERDRKPRVTSLDVAASQSAPDWDSAPSEPRYSSSRGRAAGLKPDPGMRATEQSWARTRRPACRTTASWTGRTRWPQRSDQPDDFWSLPELKLDEHRCLLSQKCCAARRKSTPCGRRLASRSAATEASPINEAIQIEAAFDRAALV
jgi:hypothetical protein